MDKNLLAKGEDFVLSDLGTFVQETDKIFVSDPSYNYIEKEHAGDPLVMKLNLVITDVFIGKWVALICVKNIDHNRNAELICVHESVDLSNKDINNLEWKFIDDICVDSGRVGVYDLEYYRNLGLGCKGTLASQSQVNLTRGDSDNDTWSFINCLVTSTPTKGGVTPHGAVSSSGYGDGIYPTYILKNSESQVIGVKVVFIDPDHEQTKIHFKMFGISH